MGLCVPCSFVRARDADTVGVSLPDSERIWWVRLLDCWAPELPSEIGRQGKEVAESLCFEASERGQFYLQIPFDNVAHNVLASLLSFDRVLGVLWLDERRTLNHELIARGLASATKPIAERGD